MLIALSFSASVLSAQDEQWDVYMANYDKGAGSTLIDLSLKDKAPIKPYAYSLVTGVKFKDCTADGFPTNAEFQKLYAISDSVKAWMNSHVKHITAGSFTYKCERVDYYYLTDTAAVRRTLLAHYKQSFPEYEPIVKLKNDVAWEGYLKFLYPNEETLEYMRNTKVVMKLQEAGDKLNRERQVDHWLYFATEADREAFIKDVVKNNFKVEDKHKVDKTGFPFQLHLSCIALVDLQSITSSTLLLKKNAEKYHGNYGGWETFIVK